MDGRVNEVLVLALCISFVHSYRQANKKFIEILRRILVFLLRRLENIHLSRQCDIRHLKPLPDSDELMGARGSSRQENSR